MVWSDYPPPPEIWANQNLISNFFQFFFQIYDRKDFILLTFFWKKCEIFQIFLIHYISDHSLIFSKI